MRDGLRRAELRLERRPAPSAALSIAVPVASIGLALLVGAVLLGIAGADPIRTYGAMLEGAFGRPSEWGRGSFHNLSETLVKAIPLMLCGLGVGIAFRMVFWNVGAEGQLVMGAIGATGAALAWGGSLPAPLVLPAIALAGFAAGAVWGVVPALLKVRLRVNEIITTLMMNYIAILFMEYLFFGPWKDPQGWGFPGTAEIPSAAWLPRLPGTRVHAGLLFAAAAALFAWVVLEHTKWGYEIRVMGESRRAASFGGIDTVRNVVLVMALSGGLAGLAGMAEVAGITHRLQKGVAVGYGYTAIIVAWLAGLAPGMTLLAAFCLAALLVGGDQIQITMKQPASIALILQGTILCCMLGGGIFTRYRLRLELRPRHGAAAPPAAEGRQGVPPAGGAR